MVPYVQKSDQMKDTVREMREYLNHVRSIMEDL